MHTVTCQTDGCANAGIPVDLNLSWEDDGTTYTADQVVCGVCGEQITDVREAGT